MQFYVNSYEMVNSLLEVTQDEITMDLFVHKAFIEISSPTDFLPQVFLCHLSFDSEPTMYSCGFTMDGCHPPLTCESQCRNVCVIPGMGNEDSCTTPFPGWAASAPDEVTHVK